MRLPTPAVEIEILPPSPIPPASLLWTWSSEPPPHGGGWDLLRQPSAATLERELPCVTAFQCLAETPAPECTFQWTGKGALYHTQGQLCSKT